MQKWEKSRGTGPLQTSPKRSWYQRLLLVVAATVGVWIQGLIAICVFASLGLLFGVDLLRIEDSEHLGEKVVELPVIHVVEGDMTNASVTYWDEKENRIQIDGVSADWRQSVYLEDGYLRADLTPTNGPQDRGSITCKLMQNGNIIMQQTATGPGASVRCATNWHRIPEHIPDNPDILYAPRGGAPSAASNVEEAS